MVRTAARLRALLVLLAPAACAPSPDPARMLTPPQLAELVTDRTLLIRDGTTADDATLLYLARNGTGWLDHSVRAGFPLTPGGISMVLSWRLDDASRVCLWATPRIGEIPTFAPVGLECIQVLRAGPPYAGAGLNAVVTRAGNSSVGWLDTLPFNAFPPPVIDTYLDQLRVLFGGQVPRWTIYGNLPPPA